MSKIFERCSRVENIEFCEYAFKRFLDIKDTLRSIIINEIFIHGLLVGTSLMYVLHHNLVIHLKIFDTGEIFEI